MTTFIAFLPNPNGTPPFQSPVTLDGASYSMTVTWSLAGQRYYMTLLDAGGNLAWSGAMIGSPLQSDLFLAPGIFTTSTILYREDTGNIEVNP